MGWRPRWKPCTIYCYYKHYATLPQNVDGRKQSDLTLILYHAIHRRKGAKQPDFNTIYCYYKHYATLPQNVDGREQSNLTSRLYTITTKCCWKGAKQPNFNTVYCYHRRKGAKQPDFNTIYCYHRKTGAKQPDFNTIYYYYKHYTILPQKVDEREQSNLTSTLYTITTESWWKRAERPDFNTI